MSTGIIGRNSHGGKTAFNVAISLYRSVKALVPCPLDAAAGLEEIGVQDKDRIKIASAFDSPEKTDSPPENTKGTSMRCLLC